MDGRYVAELRAGAAPRVVAVREPLWKEPAPYAKFSDPAFVAGVRALGRGPDVADDGAPGLDLPFEVGRSVGEGSLKRGGWGV